MNHSPDTEAISAMKFGIGQSVPRSEDPTLVRGEGRYTDDVVLPDQAFAAMVRSPYAHGLVRSIGTETAKAMPGVFGVFTGADLAEAGMGALDCATDYQNRDGTPMRKPRREALAGERVRFVGDPVAVVVAATAAQARDAAEAVELDIEPLPATSRAADACVPGAPQIYDDVPGNVFLDYHYGDAPAVAAAFDRAAHVTRLALESNRVVVNPMEPRSAIGHYDATTGRWTLHVGSQGVFGLRHALSGVLGVAPEQVRILTPHVGGSFGMKAFVYPEYVCVLHASRVLGRPVKWTDQRSESFLSDTHGRDLQVNAELALDTEGRFLALRVSGHANFGAYLNQVAPLFSTTNIAKNAVGTYRTPLIEVSIVCALTNTTPIGPYRGAGRPDGNYFMERLIDNAAAEMGLDRVALRRLNHIRPEEMPFDAASGMTYDSGEFSTILARACVAADWEGFASRRALSEERGRLRGIGIGQYLEVTAPPTREMGGIRFEADGTVTIVTGTLDYGQGHATPFAQVLTSRLGIPFDRIRLVQGDSDQLIAGGGTGGSKSIMASGAAIVEASDLVIEKGRGLAAFALEAGIGDVEFKNGRYNVVGTDRGITLLDLAQRLRDAPELPDDLPRSLDVRHVHESSPAAFPNGCHVAEVEIDPETGEVFLQNYVMVNDFGTLINPLLVEGQLHGGVVQGFGQAIMERTVYDADAQPVSGSFMDYALPRAEDVPFFHFESHPVPARTNPLGVKGCGEAGCAGALPSIMNAIVDALRPLGIAHIDMPATPQRVWNSIQEAKRRSG